MKVFTTIKSVLAAVLAVVAAFAVMTAALAIVGVLLLHFAPLCGEDTLSEKTAPDGKHVAVLMERNCGATTPYAYHINLRPASARFASGFFDGTVKDGEVVVSDRPPYYAWQDGATLVISPGGQLYSQHGAWKNVQVKYTGQP